MPDPQPGQQREGVAPGEWKANDLGLPADCPVQPLGMEGDILYLVDELSQLTGVVPSSFGQAYCQRLFGQRQHFLYWAWPQHNGKGVVVGFRAEKVREAFYRAGARKGLWRAIDKVRGLGAWLGASGELILHCGDHLYVGDRAVLPGEVGGYFYPRRPKIASPWRGSVEGDNPAFELLTILKRWTWTRPDVDPMLVLGWIGAALVAGALPWRPSLFIVGDSGAGKSTLQGLVKTIFGDGMVSTSNTTAAGIYQHVGMDALPIAVDELEAGADNQKVRKIVELAREAASGGVTLRGGANNVGVEFKSRSTFLFSAINRPPLPPQDLNRLGILSIGKRVIVGGESAPTLSAPETIAPRLLRRMVDAWDDEGTPGAGFQKTYATYRQALFEGGHDNRGQDTYGIFLACAAMLLGEDGLEAAGLSNPYVWGTLLEAAALPEREDVVENWQACLTHLLTSRVEAWHRGARQTVGALLRDLASGEISSLDFARRELEQAGLGIIDRGGFPPAPAGYVLAIPNRGQLVAGMFKGTPWGGEGAIGSWAPALRMGPEHIVFSDKAHNRASINGVRERCTMVSLKAFEEHTKG